MAGGCPQGLPPKKVMLWMANPYPQAAKNITVQTFIDGLKPHRNAFTGLAYQYFAICGEGSNDPGGSNDCRPEDATGAPHLAPGHPILTPPDLGAQLTAGLGKVSRMILAGVYAFQSSSDYNLAGRGCTARRWSSGRRSPTATRATRRCSTGC